MSAAFFTFTDCNACQGEGYQLAGEGHADEHPVCCTECDGEGALEVCARCEHPFTLTQGVETCPCTCPVEVTRQGHEVVVTHKKKDLGYCTPAIDGQGVSHGWNAYANQRPEGGFARAVLEEFTKLRDAVTFVKREGVAL